MNTDSGMMNTDSGKTGKSVHVQPESAFTINQNQCSCSARIAVHLEPEYAAQSFLQNAGQIWMQFNTELIDGKPLGGIY